jgi:hypothetical protein
MCWHAPVQRLLEGLPDLVVDLFGKTIVMSDHGLDLENWTIHPKSCRFYSFNSLSQLVPIHEE